MEKGIIRNKQERLEITKEKEYAKFCTIYTNRDRFWEGYRK